jgi:hypothetical protein
MVHRVPKLRNQMGRLYIASTPSCKTESSILAFDYRIRDSLFFTSDAPVTSYASSYCQQPIATLIIVNPQKSVLSLIFGQLAVSRNKPWSLPSTSINEQVSWLVTGKRGHIPGNVSRSTSALLCMLRHLHVAHNEAHSTMKRTARRAANCSRSHGGPGVDQTQIQVHHPLVATALLSP